MHFIIGYEPSTGEIVGLQGATFEEEVLQSAGDYPAFISMASESVPDIRDKVVFEGKLVPRVKTLEELKAEALYTLTQEVENQRRRFVTRALIQDGIYLRKADEGRRFLALASIPNDLSGFPMLHAEVGITAGSARELAELWVARAVETDAALASIERARLVTKWGIENAADDTEVQAALDAFSA